MALFIFGAFIGITGLQGGTQELCLPPGHIENGEMLEEKEGFYAVTEQVQYRCHAGFETSDPLRLTCLPSGRWDFQLPRCTLARCEVSLHNVELYTPIKEVYYWGDVITVERCDSGFQLMTTNTFRCGFESPVVCAGVPCDTETLHAVRNGRVQVEGKVYVGSEVKVVCDPGFVLGSASDVFRCGTEPPPKCHRVKTLMDIAVGAASTSFRDVICLLPVALGIAMFLLRR